MWMLKLPDSAHWRWIKGPVVQVGRAPEAGISITNDKSISRFHVQLEVDHASGRYDLLVRDLGSRFGSIVDGQRIAPNTDHRVAASRGVRPVELIIGGASYTVQLMFKSMSFCSTRLDKRQKEVLKEAAQLLGARIVDAVEQCSHVICPRLTATLKVLTAIVLRKPILSLEWLNFAFETTPVPIIPDVGDYKPPTGDDVSIREPDASRSELFAQYSIILVDQKDEQYRIVLEASGAIVLNMWEDMLQLPFADVVSRVAKAILAARRPPFVFFDENHGAEAEAEVLAQLGAACKLPIRWVTAAQVAKAIVLCNLPELSSNTPRCRHSQLESNYLSQLRQSSSQLWGCEPSQSCAVESPSKRPRIEPRMGSVPSSDALFMEASSPVPSARSASDGAASSFPSPGFASFKVQPALSPRKRAAKEVVDEWDSEPVPKRSLPAVLTNPLEGAAAAISSLGRAAVTAGAPVVLPASSVPFASPSPIRSEMSTKLAPPDNTAISSIAHARDISGSAAAVGAAIALQNQVQARTERAKCATIPAMHTLPASISSSRKLCRKTPLQKLDDYLSDDDNMESAEAKLASPSPPATPLQQCQPVSSSNQEPIHGLLDGEWLVVQRRVQDMDLTNDVHCAAVSNEGAQEEGQRVSCPPIVEERPLLARIPTNADMHVSDFLHATLSKSSRGVKTFVKNRVAQRSLPPLSLQSMERVLPQESQRDLQLRLESEALERMEEEARQLMNYGG